MKIKIITRKDGTIRITSLEPLLLTGGMTCHELKAGDEGCLYTTENIKTDDVLSVVLDTDPDGIAGNTSPNVRRLHGWRGTTDDRAVFANGWRRCLSVGPCKRGPNIETILSDDLRPDEA